MRLIIAFLFLSSVAYASSCEPDCTKVLIAKAEPRIHKQVVPTIPEPKKDDIQVRASVDGNPVKCSVINDTITCEW